ncbi:MAG: tRNA (N6-isopentenyl adenosine(37)-C2)-methylthiotransferase MiaB [Eubacteriaceae bacterium]|nr:tRNA (N6-isopentenyl adenosine(37)-C2)-methylthiotransferase MiaB [Eubacteriaceae bacterium]
MSDKYYILTFGCQMNENDSEHIAGILTEKGYERTDNVREATVAVINTCSIRENADDKFFGNLGDLKGVKRENPNMILCVCGCMMQQQIFVDRIREKFPYVDIIFGTHNIADFGNLLDEFLESRKKIVRIMDSSPVIEGVPLRREYRHRAYVSITYGCDNFCTYCIVPYTRGREKSREADDIISEVKCLAEDGVKEIMLLGQNVNSYGKGLKEPCSFAELLRRVSEVEGLERIRFMTSHPRDFSDDIIDAMASSDKICKSVHLPFQAGSDRILKLMNRHYDRAYYLGLVKKLRERIPGITISTDIIVGFPTETEEDFEDTLDIVRECRFESAFTFIYSPREGTKAASMEGQIDHETCSRRFKKLVAALEEEIAEGVIVYQDSVQEVIVDGRSKSDENTLTGRTRSNKLVNFTGTASMGDTVNVKITKANTYYLYGEQI